MSRGMYYTLDGIFAAMIIISAVFLLLTFSSQSRDAMPLQTTAHDAVMILNTLTLGELNTPEAVIVRDNNLTNDSDSVLRTVALLWATNDPVAENFTRGVFEEFFPQYSFAVYAEGTRIYDKSLTAESSAVFISTAKQQVSGVAASKPVAGNTATAFLRRIENKSTASFAYFGGFVGQGNITTNLYLPSDVDATRVRGLVMEMDAVAPFTLRINGADCGYFTPVTANMTADWWNISSCSNLLVSGNNSFRLNFSNISTSYVAGGYIKATYRSDVFVTSRNTNVTRYDFPGITGVINLFDGFIVPSTLRNLSVHLHYSSTDPTVITYLTIGEKTVWQSNQTGEVDVILNDSNLTYAGLDYLFLSNKTVPIRFQSFNSTETILSGGNADIVVITDYSGSMKKDIDSDGLGNSGLITNCEGAIYPDNDIRRTHLARCLAKEVINITMNASMAGNRLWPVYYFDDRVYNYTNPLDSVALTAHYNAGMPPQGKEKTCIACALSEAYSIFKAYNQSNRSRYVILLSDGLPTHCTGAGCTGISSAYGSQACDGYCDESGACSSPPAICTNSACKPAMTNAYVVAQKLKDDFNATVFTIAFGPVESCTNATDTLIKIADITNGTYNHSSNPQELRKIYQNISYSILERITLVSQTAKVPEGFTPSTLYNDSYVIATHDQPSGRALPNEIEITRQTPPFASCTPTVTLPTQMRFQEAHIVSYSGQHWTDFVSVNNQVAFNLSDFLVYYARLGDPYRVFIPIQNLTGVNNFYINTGDNTTNSTGCSNNNSLIYTAFVPSATPRTAVLENATGCSWQIDYDDGGSQFVSIPPSYTGTNQCFYTGSLVQYDSTDALQVAVYEILLALDFDQDGRIFVSLNEEDLEIIVTKIGSVPYLWGPSIVEVRVWQ
jgi:hypothetical protein